MTRAQLFRANFNGSILDSAVMQRTNLQYATFNYLESKAAILSYADLRAARLQNAEFTGANLSGTRFEEEPEKILPAYLDNTDFRGANLFLANFTGCFFYGTKFESACIRGANIYEAHLEEVNWGNYIVGEESRKEFYFAEHCYRYLKTWYAKAGLYDISGEFFFREMTVRRKLLKWRPNPLIRALSKLMSILCGYGERPWRVLVSALVVVLASALIYFVAGSVWEWGAFWSSLYFSAVSFTALGYGSWLWTTSDWIKGIGAFESFIGVFMIALFLITFVRKMTR